MGNPEGHECELVYDTSPGRCMGTSTASSSILFVRRGSKCESEPREVWYGKRGAKSTRGRRARSPEIECRGGPYLTCGARVSLQGEGLAHRDHQEFTPGRGGIQS